MDAAQLELDERLTNGPVADVYRAEEALAIITAIGENSDDINSSTFAPAFVALQSYAIETFILAVNRLFEAPTPRYPLRSLPAIVRFVHENAEQLPLEQSVFLLGLERLGAEISRVPDWFSVQATRADMDELLNVLPTPDNNRALLALKSLRDKRLAHPEHIEASRIPKTAWEPAQELLHTAQEVIGVLGAYTNTGYVDFVGQYIMSSDAQAASIATRRLLREPGIVKAALA